MRGRRSAHGRERLATPLCTFLIDRDDVGDQIIDIEAENLSEPQAWRRAEREFWLRIRTAGSCITTGRSTRSARCCASAPSTRRCTMPGETSRRLSSSLSSTAPGAAGPAGAGHRAGAGAERATAPCAPSGARGHARTGRYLEPGGLMRLACRRLAAERACVGGPARLGAGGRRGRSTQGILIASLRMLRCISGTVD